MMMLVRGRAVVVLGMVVPEVLVHVQRRPHRGRDDQGLNERACDEAAHKRESTTDGSSSPLVHGQRRMVRVLRLVVASISIRAKLLRE
jgi:hypothetical protein